MAEHSGIEWTDATWNCIIGCTKVSSGCAFCYPIKDVRRMSGNPNDKIRLANIGLVERKPNGVLDWTGIVRCLPERLSIPLRWKKPRRIFVNSMSDLFHKDVPFDFVDKVFAVMALCPQHTFQILTKRPERMAEYYRSRENGFVDGASDCVEEFWDRAVDDDGKILPHLQKAGWGIGRYYDEEGGKDSRLEYEGKLPLPNVWLGTSVENQECADERIPHLLRCPAAVRFLSCEPLLGLVDLTEHFLSPVITEHRFGDTQAWVIVGGESGPKARPMHPDWARSLRDQCQQAGIPFFFKQHGEYLYSYQCGERLTELEPLRPNNGFRSYRFSDGTHVWKVGKKAAGRLLDGRTWDEMPAAANLSAPVLSR